MASERIESPTTSQEELDREYGSGWRLACEYGTALDRGHHRHDGDERKRVRGAERTQSDGHPYQEGDRQIHEHQGGRRMIDEEAHEQRTRQPARRTDRFGETDPLAEIASAPIHEHRGHDDLRHRVAEKPALYRAPEGIAEQVARWRRDQRRGSRNAPGPGAALEDQSWRAD